jgi:hypothetical protein
VEKFYPFSGQNCIHLVDDLLGVGIPLVDENAQNIHFCELCFCAITLFTTRLWRCLLLSGEHTLSGDFEFIDTS